MPAATHSSRSPCIALAVSATMLSLWQAEFSLTQIWDRAHYGRSFFEELIRENIDLGRPEQVQLEGRPPRRPLSATGPRGGGPSNVDSSGQVEPDFPSGPGASAPKQPDGGRAESAAAGVATTGVQPSGSRS